MYQASEEKVSLWARMCGFERSGNKAAQLRFVAWNFVWAASFVLATLVLAGDDGPTGTLGWIVAIVPTLLGVGAVLAFLGYLRNADELMRRIQLEGLGIGFGLGLLFILGYQLAGLVGAPELDLPGIALVLIVLWVGGKLFATWRYR